MKNITLAIDEEVLDKVRIVAAEKKTTVNALVREFLTDLASRDERLAEARKQLLRADGYLRRAAWRPIGSSTARKPMSGRVFLDTNVLIYAATGREAHPPKFRRAREIVASADVGISTQVIGEFVDNVQKAREDAASADG